MGRKSLAALDPAWRFSPIGPQYEMLITAYSLIFHLITSLEGRNYSIMTGFNWTLTVMSTLGFCDITFESDLGKGFSIFVLLTGIIFLLILPLARRTLGKHTPSNIIGRFGDLIIAEAPVMRSRLVGKSLSKKTPGYAKVRRIASSAAPPTTRS